VSVCVVYRCEMIDDEVRVRRHVKWYGQWFPQPPPQSSHQFCLTHDRFSALLAAGLPGPPLGRVTVQSLGCFAHEAGSSSAGWKCLRNHTHQSQLNIASKK
jgi:hypothetical protein